MSALCVGNVSMKAAKHPRHLCKKDPMSENIVQNTGLKVISIIQMVVYMTDVIEPRRSVLPEQKKYYIVLITNSKATLTHGIKDVYNLDVTADLFMDLLEQKRRHTVIYINLLIISIYSIKHVKTLS